MSLLKEIEKTAIKRMQNAHQYEDSDEFDLSRIDDEQDHDKHLEYIIRFMKKNFDWELTPIQAEKIYWLLELHYKEVSKEFKERLK